MYQTHFMRKIRIIRYPVVVERSFCYTTWKQFSCELQCKSLCRIHLVLPFLWDPYHSLFMYILDDTLKNRITIHNIQNLFFKKQNCLYSQQKTYYCYSIFKSTLQHPCFSILQAQRSVMMHFPLLISNHKQKQHVNRNSKITGNWLTGNSSCHLNVPVFDPHLSAYY